MVVLFERFTWGLDDQGRNPGYIGLGLVGEARGYHAGDHARLGS
jgi:hypothetical protein